MLHSMTYAASLLLCYSLLLLLLLLILAFTLPRRSSRMFAGGNLPPGTIGLPLLGETLRIIAAYRSGEPEPFVDERLRRHGGRLFTTHLFGELTVFSADPEFNRLVLAGEGRTFECSYPSSITTLLGGRSLLLMKGALHKRMHSLTLTRFASPAAIRSFFPDIDHLLRRSLRGWASSVRLLDQAKKIAFELTVEQLMSQGPGEWTESLRRHYNALINGFFSVPLPSFLSFTTYGRAIKARKKVADALMELVKRRKEEKRRETEAEAKRTKKDMLDELLEAEGFTDEEMVDFLLALLVAGHETTPMMMTLAVKFLTDNPSALTVVKEEQEEIRARKKDELEALEWSDYKSMPFTQCVINETLRFANIISGVFRRTLADVDFKGYRIPKGCKVFASFRAVHLDEKYFNDARAFNPWRWLNQNNMSRDGEGQQAGGAPSFTPFGGGQRLCPGYELARVEVSVFLHYLVTCFRWEEAEKDKLVFFPTTRMLNGYPIHVKPHRSL